MPSLETGNAAPQTPAQGQAGFSFLTLPGASFYFDLSPEHVYLPHILVMIIKKHGAKHSTFLDKSVTHLVTDKASTIAESHANSTKWKMTVWSLSQFLSLLMGFLEGLGDNRDLVLVKASLKARNRDLNQCLEEERRSFKLKPARMTPLYAAGTNVSAAATAAAGIAGVAGSKITTAVKAAVPGGTPTGKPKPDMITFTHPYVLIEEGDLLCVPLYKQYPPPPPPPPTEKAGCDRVTFPVIRWDTSAPMCPFYYFLKARPDGKYRSDLATNEAELAAHAKTAMNPLPEIVAIHHNHVYTKAEQDELRAKTKGPVKRITFGGDPAKRAQQQAKEPEPKPKPGYCECCLDKYVGNPEVHLAGEKHQAFAGNPENYAALDRILGQMLRPTLYEYNPILVWGETRRNQVQTAHMSPAQSQHVKRKPVAAGHASQSLLRSTFRPVPLPITIEDKENDSPSGLDMTGVDKAMVAKRSAFEEFDSSDIFQTAPKPSAMAMVAKRKIRRIAPPNL